LANIGGLYASIALLMTMVFSKLAMSEFMKFNSKKIKEDAK
jgi:hypothetical protein